MPGTIYVSSGGAKAFAYIGVTYPAGSTLTCTNGEKTLKAKTTTGQWVFGVPKAGEWEVTATYDDERASQTVNISSAGQGVSVSLEYKDYVIHNGILKDGYRINTTSATYEVVDGALEFRSAAGTNGNGSITINANGNAIDLSNRSVLKFDTEATSPRGGTADYVQWGVSGAATVKKNLGVSNPVERQIVSIDISKISSGSISLFISDVETTVALRIYDAWFE